MKQLDSKDKRIVFLRLLIIVIPFVVLGIIIFIKIKPYSVREEYEMIWQIDLPDSLSLVEDHKETSFDGYDRRFTIFEITKNEEINLKLFKYKNEYDDICEDILNYYSYEISTYPDLSVELYVSKVEKKNKDLIVLFDPSSKRLYCFVKPY